MRAERDPPNAAKAMSMHAHSNKLRKEDFPMSEKSNVILLFLLTNNSFQLKQTQQFNMTLCRFFKLTRFFTRANEKIRFCGVERTHYIIIIGRFFFG